MSKQDKSQQGKNGGGAIPSRKMGIMVYYRNQIKRDYIYLLDYDPEVISFEAWPCTITYTQNGQEDAYTPDFCVARRQGRHSIVICTWAAQTQNPQHLARWTAAQLWCEKYSYELQLVTEIVLYKHQVLLSNLKRIAVHAHQPLPPQAYEYLMRTIMSEPEPLTAAEIVQRSRYDARLTRSYLWHLLATGNLTADLTVPLNQQTLLFWKGVKALANT